MNRVEIITIGDELLSGETVDTNSNYLDGVLEGRGWTVVRHTTVADDVDAIALAFREASARADLVISSGGLGPTIDDITMEGLARALGVKLRRDEPTLEAIRAKFRAFGREMTPNNERQAMVPARGEVIPNASGTAPAFQATILGTPVFVLPGVPREVTYLVEHEILRRLPERALEIRRRTIKVVGLGESRLEHVIRGVIAAHPRVVFGFRALGAENHVKLKATGQDASEVLEAAARDVTSTLGERVFGTDPDSMPKVVGSMLARRGETLAIAESCTGGLLSKLVTDVPGASQYFVGSVVSYANAVKADVLGVDRAVLEREGAVSEAVAEQMAVGVRGRLHASFGLSVTGIAGPSGGSTDKPVGLAFVAGASASRVEVLRLQLPGDRNMIRHSSAILALDLLRRVFLR